ncbi:MAG: hypothetical protein ACYTGX_17535, partial [Planctomycetota bacterium]
RAQQQAVLLFARWPHPEVIKTLAVYLEHQSAPLSRSVAVALAHLGWELEPKPRGGVVKILTHAAERHAERRPQVTLAALAGIEALGDRRASAALVRLLNSGQPAVQDRAALALGVLRAIDAVPALLELLVRLSPAKPKAGQAPDLGGGWPTDADRTRAIIRQSLHRITGHDDADPLAWRQWWKANRGRLIAAARTAAARDPFTRAARRPALLRDHQPPVGPKNTDRAVQHACAYLLERLERPAFGFSAGFPAGARALSILALAHAGHATDERVRRATAAMAGELPAWGATVYTVSIECMALERVDGRRWQEAIARRAWFLVNAQRENGGWSYGGPPVGEVPETIPTGAMQLTRFPGVQLTGRKRAPEEAGAPATPGKVYVVKRRRWFENPWMDFSNTQFAVLGLHAAERAHVRCPDSTWVAVANLHLPRPSGLWGYHGEPSGIPSMIAGGLSTLAVLREVLLTQSKVSDAARDAGFRALGRIAPRGRFGGAAWANGAPSFAEMYHLYWLYSLERACVLWDQATIGGEDWYAPAAKRLVDTQASDGSWGSPADTTGGLKARGQLRLLPNLSVVNTAFAVLFLRKAAPIQRRAQVTKDGADAGTPGEDDGGGGTQKDD